MGDGLRTVRVVTSDESLLACTRAAVQALEGWELAHPEHASELLECPPVRGDMILLDSALREANVYEVCRSLTGKTQCRTFVVVDQGNTLAEPIAHFCGATGVLERPLSAEDLRSVLERAKERELPQASRTDEPPAPELTAALLRDLTGDADTNLIGAITDPETSLFNYAFLNYKLEEEFKRADRFEQPLACVMLGFEGQTSEQTLRELTAIFLQASRDTDVLGRFDENSFLFLLPNTGPDGAQVMARRVEQAADSQGLRDLVGDRLQIAVGISFHPHPDIKRREDLYARARAAFFEARQEGGGVVTSA